jgi:hypothetical protein
MSLGETLAFALLALKPGTDRQLPELTFCCAESIPKCDGVTGSACG